MNMKKLVSTTAMALVLTSQIAMGQMAASFGDNILINPWMEIDQPNEGAAKTITRAAAGTFTEIKATDGWTGLVASSGAGTPTFTLQNAAVAPNGSVVDLLYTSGTGSATHADGTAELIYQKVEPIRMAALQYGTANAQPAYLSFCVKSSVAGSMGFFLVGGTNTVLTGASPGILAGANNISGSAYFHQFNVPVAAQWSCNQFVIPGDTGGTWLATNPSSSTHGLTVGFVAALNGLTTSTYGVPDSTHVDGAWQNIASAGQPVIGNNAQTIQLDKVTGGTLEITGVKLALNPSPLTHDPSLEILQAERYFAKTFTVGVGGASGVAPAAATAATSRQYVSGTATTNTIGGVYWSYPTAMAAVPAITRFSVGGVSGSGCVDMANTATSSASTIEPNTGSNVAGVNGTFIKCATSLGNTAGDEFGIAIQADARL